MTPILIQLRRGPYTKLPNIEIKCDGEVVYTTDTNQLYVAKEGIWVRYAGGDIEVILTAPNRFNDFNVLTYRPKYRNSNEIVPLVNLVYSKEEDWMYVGDDVTPGGIKVA